VEIGEMWVEGVLVLGFDGGLRVFSCVCVLSIVVVGFNGRIVGFQVLKVK